MSQLPIAFARGDGIGPEIMAVALDLLAASGAAIELHEVEIGEKVYLRGHTAGIEPSTWETLRHTAAFLKAPITTPQGGGFKSLNVTVRNALGLYANVRRSVAYAPFIATKHPGMDLVIIRENEEDLYTGIEYRATEEAVYALKLISRPGCEKIIRYAFEYARSHGRRKVTCFAKDNILKLSDGLFRKVFDQIATDYPDLQSEYWIVDIGAAKMADTPEAFDVLVMANLYGDILSDVAAQIAGSVGLAGSANIGEERAMFEAIHGSAPRRAGLDLANPSALILASVMMLAHIGQTEAAELIHNAWLVAIEEGIHTYDIFKEGVSQQKVGTKAFGEAVKVRLGKRPQWLQQVTYAGSLPRLELQRPASHGALKQAQKVLEGVDLFVEWQGNVEGLQQQLLQSPLPAPWRLKMIANRGASVWPEKMPETQCIDSWRCRFVADGTIDQQQLLALFHAVDQRGLQFTNSHQLYRFDGRPGYALSPDEQ